MKTQSKNFAASSLGNCRLCREERALCRSHIIPESAFKPSYDATHRAHLITVDTGRRRSIQVGYRERLLCQDCEQRLNRFEDYFADVWFHGKRPEAVQPGTVTVSGLDYARFKLFHMSVLWRAGISSRPQFRDVRLGPHQERLRKMVLAEDPGDPTEYPFWGLMLHDADSGHVFDDVIIEPGATRIEGHSVYTFTFGGCSWFYIASTHAPPKAILPALFGRNGVLKLGVQDFLTYGPIVEAARRYRANAKKGDCR